MPPARGRIVVGVDGSTASVKAMHWACGQAELVDGTVQLVTGWQVPTQYGNEFAAHQFDWAGIAQQTLDTEYVITHAHCPVLVVRDHRMTRSGAASRLWPPPRHLRRKPR